MRKTLSRKFFSRNTHEVARELLGKYLVRKLPGGSESALLITEVEVYDGHEDKGSHASRGMTRRNKPMFGPAGSWYIYFTYGMHWLLNIATREEGYPAAILIRGTNEISGPARITKYLSLDGSLSGMSATRKTGLWLEDRGFRVPERSIHKGPRIGIDYAGPKWSKKPWRYWFEPVL